MYGFLDSSSSSVPSFLTQIKERRISESYNSLFQLISSILSTSDWQSLLKGHFLYSDDNITIRIDHYFIQLCGIREENGDIAYYQMIIADNSDGNKKGMIVLTADSVDSELVEMDCSGMKEDVIIDLNREGRRWEGGELTRSLPLTKNSSIFDERIPYLAKSSLFGNES